MRGENDFTRVVVRTRGGARNQDQSHSHAFERAIVHEKDRSRFIRVTEQDGTETWFPVAIVRKVVIHPEPGSGSRLDDGQGEPE